MSKSAHGSVHVNQTSAEMRLCRDTSHLVNQWEIMLETAHNHGLVCQKMRTDTSFLTANMSHSAFAESKTMETFHSDMSTYVKSCTRTRPRKSKWCRVISWSVVVVSCSSCSVNVLLGRRGQSFFRGQSVVLIVVVSRRGQSFFVYDVYILWLLCTRIY